MRLPVLFTVLLLLPTHDVAHAQSKPGLLPPNDSVFRRARRLVTEGNGPVGRALVDSMLKREQEGSAGYGNTLYWRGALAETAAEAERDYRRVIVEYALSAYADDALLAMAELEQARGDRAGALQHLQRFVKEHPASPSRGTAALAAARLAFEQRDPRTGCALISEARTSASTTDIELRNQIDYLGSRCAPADVAATALPASMPVASAPAPPARDTIPPAVPAARKAVTALPSKPLPKAPVAQAPAPPTAVKPNPVSGPEVSAPTRPATPAVTPRGAFTIQLAAYNTRAEAERLVARLRPTGVTARVSGATKPFRVRLDFYPTRQAALEEVAALKRRGIIGFVTTEGPPPEDKRP